MQLRAVTLALDYLRRRGVTSSLAVLGVAIGVGNIIALISVTDTARRQTSQIMRDMGADSVLVIPYVEDRQGQFMAANSAAFLPGSFLTLAAAVPEIEAAAAVLLFPAHAGASGERVFTLIEGATPQYPEVRAHQVARGRFLTEADEQARARVCTLGYSVDQRLFPAGDALGQAVTIKGEQFTVVGAMVEKGMLGFTSMDDRLYVPLSTAQELFQTDGLHFILLKTAKGVPPKQAQAAVQRALYAAEGLKEGDPAEFSVTTFSELTDIIDNTMVVFRLLLYGISSVALLVAGIGIMNVMLMQVLERTREIGVRRAAGARRRDIWVQFLTEAVAQSVAGSVAGTLLGIAAAWVFCLFVEWTFFLRWETVALASAVALATGIGFGVFPALHAARLKPIDCLRYE